MSVRDFNQALAEIRRICGADATYIATLKRIASGLTAGEQPGGAAPRREGSSGFESQSAHVPAPAEKPFVTDWKKGKK